MKAIGRPVDVLIEVLELSAFTRGELHAVAPDAYDVEAPLTEAMFAAMRPLAQLELANVAEGSL